MAEGHQEYGSCKTYVTGPEWDFNGIKRFVHGIEKCEWDFVDIEPIGWDFHGNLMLIKSNMEVP